MNQSPLKKIIKIVLAFAVIGAIVFFGIKFLFPEPDSLQAYQTTYDLVTNTSAQNFLQTSDSMIELMTDNLQNPVINLNVYNKLKISQNNLKALVKTNQFLLNELAFAKNNSNYNTNAKTIAKVYGQITDKYAQIDNYIKNNVVDFLKTQNQTVQSINSYSAAILNYQISLNQLYVDYTRAAIKIYTTAMPSQSFSNNEWSKQLVTLAFDWSEKLNHYIQNTLATTELLAANIANSAGLFAYVDNNLTIAKAQSYYTNSAVASLLEDMKKTYYPELVAKVLTQDEQTYINSFEDQTKKVAVENVIHFLKGE